METKKKRPILSLKSFKPSVAPEPVMKSNVTPEVLQMPEVVQAIPEAAPDPGAGIYDDFDILGLDTALDPTPVPAASRPVPTTPAIPAMIVPMRVRQQKSGLRNQNKRSKNGKATIAELILDVLEFSEQAMGPKKMEDSIFKIHGQEVSNGSIRTNLVSLKKRGLIRSDGMGKWRLTAGEMVEGAA